MSLKNIIKSIESGINANVDLRVFSAKKTDKTMCSYQILIFKQ